MGVGRPQRRILRPFFAISRPKTWDCTVWKTASIQLLDLRLINAKCASSPPVCLPVSSHSDEISQVFPLCLTYCKSDQKLKVGLGIRPYYRKVLVSLPDRCHWSGNEAMQAHHSSLSLFAHAPTCWVHTVPCHLTDYITSMPVSLLESQNAHM